jgi:hypothetical protein
VQVFGRRDDETDHALKRLATKKRQGTKSRQLGTGWQQAHGDCMSALISMVGACEDFRMVRPEPRDSVKIES